ncbi:hypothetical protein [Streptomyces sp. TRM70350]|uniref:hypothetical protein n=1 Tax=Streptomyces sp. TRM70350 TaxID=2856165 RepID=UPI001C43FED9|nr:hypothetical protein [Streptomyces sp. TRM70350]MBV7698611.1 hypothetical protein [Streptomyces sp. TRM70350]
MRHVHVERAYLADNLMRTLADIGGAEAEQYLVRLLHTPTTWQPIPRHDFYPLVPATDWVIPALCSLGDTVMLRALFDLLAEHQPVHLRRNAAEELSRLAHSIGASWSLPGPGRFEVTEAGRNMFVLELRSVLDDEDHSVRVNVARALQNVCEQ